MTGINLYLTVSYRFGLKFNYDLLITVKCPLQWFTIMGVKHTRPHLLNSNLCEFNTLIKVC